MPLMFPDSLLLETREAWNVSIATKLALALNIRGVVQHISEIAKPMVVTTSNYDHYQDVLNQPHQSLNINFPKRLFGKQKTSCTLQLPWFHEWQFLHYDED